MKYLSYLLPGLVICLLLLIWQQYDLTIREQQARALVEDAQDGEADKFKARVLEAINLLEFKNFWGHIVLANPYLEGAYYYMIASRERDAELKRQYYQLAQKYYLLSTRQKPTYSSGWASLAKMKWLNNEADEQFEDYIMLAHKYGEHDFQAHLKLVQIAAWMVADDTAISPELERVFAHHTKYGLEHKKSVSHLKQNVVDSTKLRKIFCKWVKGEVIPQKHLRCSQF